MRKNIFFLSVLAMTFLLCGCEKEKTVVITAGLNDNQIFQIEDEICNKNEMVVYLVNTENSYSKIYGDSISSLFEQDTTQDSIKEDILSDLCKIKVLNIYAEEKKATLTEEDKVIVNKAAGEYYATLSESDKSAMNVTENDIEKMYYQYRMAEKVYHDIVDSVNPEISDDEARTVTYKQIFVSDIQNGKSKINEARSLIMQGKNFDDLAIEYGDGENLLLKARRGELEKACENTLFNLENDEISKVVETESGYYIFKCISNFDKAETEKNRNDIIKQKKEETFCKEYDSFVNTLVGNFNERAYNKIKIEKYSEITSADFFDIYNKYFQNEE